MSRYLLPILCTLLLFGCEQKNETPSESVKLPAVQLQPLPEVTRRPVLLLKEPIMAVLVETAAEAIPTWRKYAAAKPTLVLLSQNPFLTPIPEQVENEALQLVRNGSSDDFKAKSTPYTADPIILPEMALSAALDAGFFSKIVWILPTADDQTALSLETFRRQLTESGIATQDEASSFSTRDKGLAGTLRQLPIEVIPYKYLAHIDGPAVIHLDQTFLKKLYKSEIKTPIHPLVYQLLAKLRSVKILTLATTLSQSHHSGDISLKVRFLLPTIERFLSQPDLLDQSPSPNDQRHQQALYLENFFQKEKILELYLAMGKDTPQNAAVKYALYQISRQFKLGDKALNYLTQAVSIDPVYALEYLDLATMALEKGRPQEALRMLELAKEQFPINPFIQLSIADLLAATGESQAAIAQFETLMQLPWSELYFKRIRDSIKARIEAAQQAPHAKLEPQEEGGSK